MTKMQPRVTCEKINVVLWNGQSVRSKQQLLKKFLHTNSINIALLNETKFRNSDNINFTGYNIERLDREDGHGGVAILISKDIRYELINLETINYNKQIEICGVHLTDLDLNILTVYNAPRNRTSRADWNNIVTKFPNRTLIAGDFNAHHRLWGSPRDDRLGNMIVDILEDHNFIVLNDGSPTRLSRPNQNVSAVDISIATADLTPKISWTVMDENIGSDHYVIQMTLCESWSPQMIIPSARWKEESADWPLFRSLISSSLLSSSHSEGESARFGRFCEVISEAANNSMSLKKPFIPASRCPLWWDKDCSDIDKQRKNALSRYKRLSNYENFCIYKNIEAQAKKLFKQKSRKSWENFVNKLNKNTPSSLIWNTMKRISNKNYRTPIKPINKEIIEGVLDRVCPLFVPDITIMQTNNVDEQLLPRRLHRDQIDLDSPFSNIELDLALVDNRKSAPGFDFITYSMIKNLPLSAKSHLLELFNSWWREGNYLPENKTAILILFLKAGKDSTLPSSYRPISLFPCITKVFERLIKSRLQWYLEHFDLLPSAQYGFRKGYGTIDAVTHLVTDIYTCFSKNRYLPCLFVDIKGAYDCVNLDLLYRKMVNLKLSREVATSVVNLFRDRKVFVRDHQGQLHGPRLANEGLPQGSVLSPILFNIYTEELHRLMDDSINVVQYADDICIYSVQNTYEKAIEVLELIMHNLKHWCSESNMTISPEKSAVVIFTRHRTPAITHITLAEVAVPVVSRYKYLGIILDSKLLWSPHITYVKQRCERGINMLKFVSKRKFGASPMTSLMFYRAYIRSILDYGCTLYGASAKSNLIVLDRVQCRAIRICIGCMRSSPVFAILSEAQELPLKYRRMYLASKFLIKLEYFSKVDHLNKLSSLTAECLTNSFWFKKSNPPLVDAFLVSKEVPYGSKKHFPFNMDYECLIYKPAAIFPEFNDLPVFNAQLARAVLSRFPYTLNIFTDGSKTKEGVGGAFYIPSLDFSYKFKLDPLCSVYTAEAFAIDKALQWALDNTVQDILVLSDAKSVLTAIIGDGSFHNPLIYDIKNKLLSLKSKNCKVTLIWVKGHTGILYNEIVDQLAKSAVSLNETPILDIYAPYDIISALRLRINLQWQDEYRGYASESSNPYFLVHPAPAKPQEYMHGARHFAVTMTRLKMNHGLFPSHLNKIGLRDTPFCLCDDHSIGDLNHLIFSCPLNTSHRIELMDVLKRYVQLPVSTVSLMCTDNISILRALYLYTRLSGISI